MPTTLQQKYSATPGADPTTSDLTVPAQLAINVADGQLYTRDADDNIRKLGGATNIAGDTTFEGDVTVEGDIIFQGSPVIRPGVVNSVATTYNLTLTDENKIILISNSSAITVNVPLNATTPLPIGFITHIHQAGTGQITLDPEGAAVVNAASSLSTRAQYSALSLFKVAEDAWVVVGDQE